MNKYRIKYNLKALQKFIDLSEMSSHDAKIANDMINNIIKELIKDDDKRKIQRH